MPRKSRNGRFIIPAGEIGAYTVCPEAWRLRALVRAKTQSAPSEVQGRKLHEEWAARFDEATYLNSRIRFVASLLAAAIIIFLLMRS